MQGNFILSVLRLNKAFSFRADCVCRLTYDLVPLVDVVCSRKENSSADHLAHDAADGPDVDVLLVAHAQDDLRRAVVARHHVRRHHERRVGRPRQPEVQDLQRAVGADHDVARFKVLRTEINSY